MIFSSREQGRPLKIREVNHEAVFEDQHSFEFTHRLKRGIYQAVSLTILLTRYSPHSVRFLCFAIDITSLFNSRQIWNKLVKAS